MSDANKETSPQEDNPDYYPDGSPKPRTYFSVFGKIAAVALLLATPFIISARNDKKRGYSRFDD